jgi:hypothetical protein
LPEPLPKPLPTSALPASPLPKPPPPKLTLTERLLLSPSLTLVASLELEPRNLSARLKLVIGELWPDGVPDGVATRAVCDTVAVYADKHGIKLGDPRADKWSTVHRLLGRR